MEQTNGTADSGLDPRRLLWADVRRMSPSAARWYAAVLATTGIVGYILRRPLLGRSTSWPRLIVEVAVNVVGYSAMVWFLRWFAGVQRTFERDPDGAARDIADRLRQWADQHKNDLEQSPEESTH